MAKVFVKTEAGELIERILIDDRYPFDECAKDYALFVIHLAITNALTIDDKDRVEMARRINP